MTTKVRESKLSLAWGRQRYSYTYYNISVFFARAIRTRLLAPPNTNASNRSNAPLVSSHAPLVCSH
eukprot:6385573-Pyramimonas_sp.AAC.1